MQMVWIQFNSWLKMIKNGPQSTLLIKKKPYHNRREIFVVNFISENDFK